MSRERRVEHQKPDLGAVAFDRADDRGAKFWRVSRRRFLHSAAAVLALQRTTVAAAEQTASTSREQSYRDRVEGLLIGTFIGDALGGPVEFQEPQKVDALPAPPKRWREGEVLDDDALAAAAARLKLRSYRELRPVPEPYAHWSHNAEPGTITDDSRHKLILLHAMRTAQRNNAWPMTAADLARAYLDWPQSAPIRQRADYTAICAEWLHEYHLSARWVLGERDIAKSRPPERMWSGLPTCCGQMSFPPLAAIYPDDPSRAYRAAYDLAYIDNGWGRDMNAALVAGLATALVTQADLRRPEAAWQHIFSAMRSTDPYGYHEVPWTQRAVDRWLDFALQAAHDANHQPARLFARLDDEFHDTIKWEAQVPFVVAFASLAICRYQPLAALQLSIEWGHDTDSYAQLLGAFVGALHGRSIFPSLLHSTVTRRLQLDYGENLNEAVELLVGLRENAGGRPLFDAISCESGN